MKPRLILCALLLMCSSSIFAQNFWEVGARYGDEFAIDATAPLHDNQRIHAAFYVEDGFAMGLYWNWVWGLDDGPERIKLYPGVGPELFFRDGFDLGVAADLGIEYRFGIPLTIGVDWRPGLNITDGFDFHASNWGVLARFRIGGG